MQTELFEIVNRNYRNHRKQQEKLSDMAVTLLCAALLGIVIGIGIYLVYLAGRLSGGLSWF